MRFLPSGKLRTVQFFFALKDKGLPLTLRELLDLTDCLEQGVAFASLDDFYQIARLTLVKDETLYQKFDLAFSDFFRGLPDWRAALGEVDGQLVPKDWLAKQIEKYLSEEEKAALAGTGDFDKLMETLKQRLQEQEKRHQGGSKWVGNGGTSPFGAYGYNPEGVRIGQHESRHRRAVKVWDQRQFADYDGQKELGTRTFKLALRKLRRFARQGPVDKLNLQETISATARNAGYLDLQFQADRRNGLKLIVLFDVGGSMDDHIEQVENLLSAVRSEFKYLDFFYFHNCLYENLWRDNRRRHLRGVDGSLIGLMPSFEILTKFPRDTRLLIVGDATMSPYEISHSGGSVEHWNEESGAVWLQRYLDHFPKAAWLNPQPEQVWSWHQSITMLQKAMKGHMHPLTLDGLGQAVRDLS